MATTYVFYGKISVSVGSETGISEGSISTYSNPYTFDSGGQNWVDSDLATMTRMKAIETRRLQTVSDPSVNPNPHWDAWVDNSLAFNFAQRRGALKPRTYSFPNRNLKIINHSYDGKNLAYQVTAYGAGSGAARSVITSRDSTLYDASRDPFGGTRLYNDLPRVLPFEDANEKSLVSLLRKAQAFFKLHKDPIENITAQIIAEPLPYFQVGDSITIDNLNTRTNASPRVQSLKRSFSGGSNEQIQILVGQVDKSIPGMVAGQRQQTTALTVKPIPTEAASGLAGNGVYFDKSHYGVFSFPLDQPEIVDRVFLRFNILPWQATGKSSIQTPHIGFNFTQSASTNFNDTSSATFDTDLGALYTFTDLAFISINTLVGLTAHPSSGSNPVRYRIRTSTDNATWRTISTRFWDATGATEVIKDCLAVGGDAVISSVDTQFRYVRLELATPLNSTNSTTNDMRISVALYPKAGALGFGIYQFDKDSGDGTGSPTYGIGIQFAVDPPTITNGLPSNFSAERHPMAFGNDSTTPSGVDVDVTGYLKAESNGIVMGGLHQVFLLGAADATAGHENAQGLSVVSVTPVIKLKQGR